MSAPEFFRARARRGPVRPTPTALTAFALLVFLAPAPPFGPAAHAQGTSTDMGAGAAWFDLDNDSDLDLFYLTPGGGMHCMRRDPDRFVDVTSSMVPIWARSTGKATVGVAAADLNNDGRTDLFLTMNGENLLLLNKFPDGFQSVAKQSGIDGSALSSSAAVFDYDDDGLLDIYVANYEGAPNRLYHCREIRADGTPNYEEVSARLGMDRAPHGQSEWSLGLAAADFDDDGDVDLYVVNDFNGWGPFGGLEPGDNIYYRNNGDGTFTDATDTAGLRDGGWSMGVAVGDYNQDGLLDIYVADFWEDRLYRNNGNGTFTDVAGAAGLLTQPYYNSWGCAFLDFDNDGDLDIHVANGFIPNGEGQIEDEPDQLWENLGPDPSGTWHFHDVGARIGVANLGDARGASYADFDADGDLDFVVINNDFVSDALNKAELPKRCFFVNEGDGTFRDRAVYYGLRSELSDTEKLPSYRDMSDNRWIQIRPVGRVSNRSGLGTRATVRAGGRTWIQELGTSSYCSSNSPAMHFGLGPVTVIDEITLRFPSGRTGTWRDVEPDRILVLDENDVTPVRLLGFTADEEPAGVRLRWSVSDDGELAGLRLLRESAGTVVRLEGVLVPASGWTERWDLDAPAGELTYTLVALLRDGGEEELAARTLLHRPASGLVVGLAAPNPFSERTAIPFTATPGSVVTVDIFDGSGRVIRSFRAAAGEGTTSLGWDGRDDRGARLAAGVYFARATGAGASTVRKLLLRP